MDCKLLPPLVALDGASLPLVEDEVPSPVVQLEIANEVISPVDLASR